MNLLSRKQIDKQWKKFIKKDEFDNYYSFYKALLNTTQSIMLQMMDFLFIEDIYVAFLELLELHSDLSMLLETKSNKTYEMCKYRINYLLQNKLENWYI